MVVRPADALSRACWTRASLSLSSALIERKGEGGSQLEKMKGDERNDVERRAEDVRSSLVELIDRE